MEQHTYPLELLRAELKSAMAEQLVHLVDRFASKQELAALRTEIVARREKDDERFRGIDHKLDLLLQEKDQRDGAASERTRWLDSRKFTITTIVLLFTGLVSAVATLIWLATP